MGKQEISEKDIDTMFDRFRFWILIICTLVLICLYAGCAAFQPVDYNNDGVITKDEVIASATDSGLEFVKDSGMPYSDLIYWGGTGILTALGYGAYRKKKKTQIVAENCFDIIDSIKLKATTPYVKDVIKKVGTDKEQDNMYKQWKKKKETKNGVQKSRKQNKKQG